MNLSSHTSAHKRAAPSSSVNLALTLLVVAAASVGACAEAPPPKPAEERTALLAERAFWDTMRVRAAVRARERDSLHALSKLIDASIDRTRLARIAELDSLLGQRIP